MRQQRIALSLDESTFFLIDPFVLALTNPSGYEAAFPDCDISLADINGDGSVNSFDIDPFVELLTGMLLVLVCLIAGLVARSEFARARRAKLDTWLLHLIPGYAWVKGITGNIQDTEAQEVLKPVLVRFDDQYQLAFEVDRNDSGLVAIFLPGAPDARSGSVSYVAEDRVSGLDTGFSTVVKSCKNLGRGSLQMLPT